MGARSWIGNCCGRETFAIELIILPGKVRCASFQNELAVIAHLLEGSRFRFIKNLKIIIVGGLRTNKYSPRYIDDGEITYLIQVLDLKVFL